ncbi:MAG: hypothetical protein JWR69_3810 [Pedosphaera sp.]|nr:hypothetical protein [Pedosphaera sp.]
MAVILKCYDGVEYQVVGTRRPHGPLRCNASRRRSAGVRLSTLGVFVCMAAKLLHAPVRFLVAGISLLLLLLCFAELAGWSSVGSDVGRTLLEGSVAAVALVVLTPVLVHGGRIQQMVAVALLFFSLLGLFLALLNAAGYAFDFYL